jgi:hypothetical protein
MCLDETYSKSGIGRHFSDTFPVQKVLKKGDHLSPSLFSFALDYVFRNVKANQVGLKLNVTHQLLVYVVSVSFNGLKSTYYTKSTEALLVASMEVVLEVNTNTTQNKIAT